MAVATKPAGRLLAAVRVAACLFAGVAAADEPSISILTTRPQPMMANLGDVYRPLRLDGDREACGRIWADLAGRHDLEFRAAPLREAVATIAGKAGIEIGIDHESLEAAGVDPQATTVTGSFKAMSLRACLREVLGALDLATMVRNERLLVTTNEVAGRRLVRYFYPALAGTEVDQLVALIEMTVQPESWNSVGGPAAIVPIPDRLGAGLVVAQNEDAHEQITALMSGLDAALWKADQGDDGSRARLVKVHPVADPLLRESITERLVSLCNESLPHGADPDAEVEVLGDTIIVRSVSRPFHVMAAQLLAALQGLDAILIDGDETEDDRMGDDDGRTPDGVDAQATGFRRTRSRRPPAAVVDD